MNMTLLTVRSATGGRLALYFGNANDGNSGGRVGADDRCQRGNRRSANTYNILEREI